MHWIDNTKILLFLCKGSIILLSVGVSDRAAIPPVEKARVITVNNFTSITIKFQFLFYSFIQGSVKSVCSLTWVFSCLRGVIGWCNWCGWGGSTAMGTEDAADWRHPTESCEDKWDHEHLQSFNVAGMMAMVLVYYLQLVLQQEQELVQELGLLGSELELGLGLQQWLMVCDWTCSTVTESPCGWE